MFLRGVLPAVLSMVMTCSLAFGQSSVPLGSNLPGESIPTAPQSRILDQAGLLDADPEKKAEISERLQAIYQKHDLPVYLVLHSSLVAGDIGSYPRNLYEAWIGEENDGAVAVIEVDSRAVEMAFPLNAENNPHERRLEMTRLPEHLLTPLFAAVRMETKEVDDRITYVDRFSEVFTRELDLVLVGDGRSSGAGQFVLVTLLVGLVIGLSGYLCHRYTQRAEAELREQYFLPEVEIEPRLGAPYGGARSNTLIYRARREAGLREEA